MQPCIIDDLPDIWIWNNSSSGIYTSKDAYCWLLDPTPCNDITGWQWIWRLHLPANIQFWIAHPGGPAILDQVEQELGLKPEKM
ncbi:chalcone synthase, partial [Trifolium medium]|nr:chalcone synthase [Trifolium medium]